MTNKLIQGVLQPIILKLLAEEGEMYGYEMVQRVRELTAGNIEITEGALYPTLHKLEVAGQLNVSFRQVHNRQRKYYRLTEAGQSMAVSRLEELAGFLRAMQGVLNWKNV
ncbi:MAG: helix-turn-helix transcriptional regulator [Lewinellaceae bacterium]|nr:helix-turn-helix transcriptional regulator [Lewinellaceae bacterium]